MDGFVLGLIAFIVLCLIILGSSVEQTGTIRQLDRKIEERIRQLELKIMKLELKQEEHAGK